MKYSWEVGVAGTSGGVENLPLKFGSSVLKTCCFNVTNPAAGPRASYLTGGFQVAIIKTGTREEGSTGAVCRHVDTSQP